MGGYQPRRHADAGRPFPYDQVRPPAGGGGVSRSGPGKEVRREFIDRAALAAAAEAARIERRAREAERRKSTARPEQIAYPDGVPRRDPKPSKPAEQFEDRGSSEWYGVDGLVPDVFTRAFASIREHITAWWFTIAFTIVMIVGSQTDWAVMLACLAGVSAVAGTVAIIVGRRQYRRQINAERRALAERADRENQEWMNR